MNAVEFAQKVKTFGDVLKVAATSDYFQTQYINIKWDGQKYELESREVVASIEYGKGDEKPWETVVYASQFLEQAKTIKKTTTLDLKLVDGSLVFDFGDFGSSTLLKVKENEGNIPEKKWANVERTGHLNIAQSYVKVFGTFLKNASPVIPSNEPRSFLNSIGFCKVEGGDGLHCFFTNGFYLGEEVFANITDHNLPDNNQDGLLLKKKPALTTLIKVLGECSSGVSIQWADVKEDYKAIDFVFDAGEGAHFKVYVIQDAIPYPDLKPIKNVEKDFGQVTAHLGEFKKFIGDLVSGKKEATIHLTKEKIELKEGSQTTRELANKFQTTADDLDVYINGKFLSGLLKFMEGQEVQLRFYGNDAEQAGKVVFAVYTDDRFNALMMPIRV